MTAIIPPKNLPDRPRTRLRKGPICTSCDKPINMLTGECAGCTGT